MYTAGAINAGAVPADRLPPAVSRAAAQLHPQSLLRHSSAAAQSVVHAVAHKLRPKRSSSSSRSRSSADSTINLSTDDWRHEVGREPQPEAVAAASDSSSD